MQCAELAKGGKVYATATEDMDALTFRTPKLLRKMTFAPGKNDKKHTIVEIDFVQVILGLKLTYEEFVDLCILCGCDYCNTIKGIGPKTALKLIREYKTVEKVIAVLSKDKKYVIPAEWREQRVRIGQEEEKEEKGEEVNDIPANDPSEEVALGQTSTENSAIEEDESAPLPDEEELDISALNETKETATVPAAQEDTIEGIEGVDYEVIPPMFVQARKLFIQADAHPAADVDLKWTEPDEQGLKDFLVTKMGFSLDRVESGIKKLRAAQQVKAQRRMDSFFNVVAAPLDEAARKRKADALKIAAEKDKKAKKGGSFGKKK